MIRVVSLVPSLTETVALTIPQVLIGVTAWCTNPPELDVPRVGGPKTPDLAMICDLGPDLVLMSVDENCRSDAEALRAVGIPVHVIHPCTVDTALAELGVLLDRLGVDHEPSWLRSAHAIWSSLAPPRRRCRGIIPVWRDPWIIAGPDTFASDVLSRLGVDNLCPATAGRYPRFDLTELTRLTPQLVVLPDEPYPFTATDVPEAWTTFHSALISGRHLNWYGPSLAQAPQIISEQLAKSAQTLR